MITTLYRIIKYGFQNFWRNYLISIATVLVLFLSAAGFLGLLIFGAVGSKAISSVQERIDISVYFKPDAPEDDILKIKEGLRGLPEVRSVEYISKDEALEIFKKRHAYDNVIYQAIEELNVNPLSASLNIKAYDPGQYSLIASYFEVEAFKNIIDKITYSENYLIINRLARIVSLGEQGGLMLTLILAIIAAIVAFNAVLLAIYSNKEEIAIMRLVGASNTFIRSPYIFVGMIYGFLAAFLAMVVFTPFVYFISPYIEVFIPTTDLWFYFLGNFFKFFGYCLLFSMSISVVSSIVVVKRYLNV
ncbi:MAG: permease-like cell division protein FtsX [Candidatus Liptonbacteria bacterium]|nr:permease-like cell division protein FtsX [Candidatus Liptonbacteria bacterium]